MSNGRSVSITYRFVSAMVAALLALFGAFGTAGPARATGTGSMSGVVLDGATDPNDLAKMATVSLLDSAGDLISQTSVDPATAEYAFNDLDDGTYYLRFSGSNFSTGETYLDEYYPGVATIEAATPVVITAGSAATGIDQMMWAPSSLEINFKASDEVTPVRSYFYVFDSSFNYVTSSYPANEDGFSGVYDLRPGDYYVCQGTQWGNGFDFDYDPLQTWMFNCFDKQVATYDLTAPDLAGARAVTVGRGVTTLDYTVYKRPVIKGSVTDSAGSGINYVGGENDGVSQTLVTFWDASDDSWAGQVFPNTDGTYETRLNPGSYYVQFTDRTVWDTSVTDPSQAKHYYGTYYNDGSEEKTVLQVEVDQTYTGISAALNQLASISGRVVKAVDSSVGIEGVHVYLEDLEGNYVDSVDTDAEGDYLMTVGIPGTYNLHFIGGDVGYESNYYLDSDFANATSITINESDQLTGYDSQLSKAGTISGTIYGWDGGIQVPLEGVCVSASNGDVTSAACTDVDGNYTIIGLPDGDYIIGTDTSATGTDYLPRYLGNTPFESLAETVNVSAGANVTGTDLTLYHGATITGKLLGEFPGGSPVAIDRGYVSLANDDFGYGASTNAQGVYIIRGVEPATDYVLASRGPKGGPYLRGYYLDTQNPKLLTRVTATLAATTTLSDWTLIKGASLSGNIYAIINSTPTLVEGDLWLVNNTTGEEFYGWVQVGGAFKVQALTGGDYTLNFAPYSPSDYAPVFAYNVGTLVLGQASSGVDIQLELGATLSGSVSSDSTQGVSPLEGAYVSVSLIDDTRYWSTSAYSAADGTYTLTGLPVGEFELRFEDLGNVYASEYWDDATSYQNATRVQINSPADSLTGYDAVLSEAGSISGTVTFDGLNGVEGAPYAGVVIFDTNCSYLTGWSSEPDGTFLVPRLAPGTYFVMAEGFGGRPNLYYDGSSSCEGATAVEVTSGQDTAGINIHLVSGGSVSGTVTTESGTALEGASVQLYSESLDYWDWATTDVDGKYSFVGLPPSSDFKVRFAGIGNYRGEFYENADSWDSATKLTIDLGTEITGIDAGLVEGGSIHLRVLGANTGAAPSVLAGVCMDLGDLVGNWVDGGCTDQNGNITFSGLAAGDYIVDIYSEQNWLGKRLGETTKISVVKGELTELGDVTLDLASSIAGQIYGMDGQIQVPVNAYLSFVNKATGAEFSGSTQTLGSYVSPNLPAGDYTVRVTFVEGNTDYYYAGSGIDVTIGAGEAKTGVNFALSAGASISGELKGKLGDSFFTPTSLRVEAIDAVLGYEGVYRTVNINADGSYTLRGFPVGSYVIRFSDDAGGYLTAEYPETVNITTLSDSKTGIDGVLGAAARIAGRVTDSYGNAVSFADVTVFDGFGNDITTVSTDDFGYYIAGGLKPGTYKVQARGWDGEHTATYYVSTNNLAEATEVTVAAGETVDLIDIVLIRGAVIIGSVHPEEDPSKSVPFSVYLVNRYGQEVAEGMTDEFGNFVIGGVLDGTYYVKASAQDAGYYAAYWHESEDAKTAITVVAGQVVDGIDILLKKGSTITGNLSQLRNGTASAAEFISVVATNAQGENVGWAQSDAQGNYVLNGLPPGLYIVQALPSWGLGSGGSSDLLDAVMPASGTYDLTVAGITVTDVNFTLLPGGRITGKISVPQGADSSSLWVSAQARTGFFSRDGQIQPDGTYLIDGLPAGDYLVRVYDFSDQLVETYYGDATSEANAKNVKVVGTDTTANIDINLSLAASISGLVTGNDGQTSEPLWRVLVIAYNSDGDIVGSSFSKADGTYVITGLKSGTYKLHFDNFNWFYFNGPYLSEWYDNKSSEATADGITVTTGQQLTGKNVELVTNPATVQLSGVVSLSGGETPGFVEVCAYETSNLDDSVSCAWVDGGDFSYHLLLPAGGSYKVKATAWNQFTGAQSNGGWYGDTVSAANATVLTMTDGQVKTDANILLPSLNTFLKAQKPALDGDLKVGETVKVELGDWDAGVSFSYQWLLNGAEVDGATASTFTIKAADLGRYLSVVIVATKEGFVTETRISDAAEIGYGDFSVTAKPTFTGTPKVGGVLTAVVSDWDEGTELQLIWTRDGVDIPSATGSTYTLVAADLGHKISVRAVGTKDGFTTASKQSDSESTVGEGELKTTPKPTFTGTVAVGNTLTASIGTWDDGVATSLQWLRDGAAIDGATTATYVVTVADFGKKLSVKVTGSKTAYAASTATSTEVTVGAAQQTLTGTVAITGTAKVGEVLTGSAGTWDAGTTLAYRWLADGTAISGATSTSYTLTASEVGKVITFEVGSSKLGYSTKTVVSSATSAVLANITVSAAPKLSGTAKSGSTLKTTNGSFTGISSIKYSYKWYRCTSSTVASTTLSSKCVAISKATKSSYKAVTADKGKYLVAGITAKGSAGSITAYTKSSSKTK